MHYLHRDIEEQLTAWKDDSNRLPILIRGARQVGKSSLVREFGKQFEYYLEVNLELKPSVAEVFEQDLDPHRICQDLSVIYNVPVEPGKTLLFIDEIQQSKPAISALRFFYEIYPSLHVIAAGSLLEFALSELPSFGVGRIRSVFMYPFSFHEYLQALSENLLAEAIRKASPARPVSALIHKKALGLFKRFIITGGMPKVVSEYVTSANLLRCQQILDDLIVSFDDDFSKYKSNYSPAILRDVFNAVVAQNGGKFVFSKAAPDLNRIQVKNSLGLLSKAGLIHPVTRTAANGIPLGAESNSKFRKYILLDSGIFQRILGLNFSDLLLSGDFHAVNKGSLAELVVGLELLKSSGLRRELFYWARDAKNSQAEVDYIVQVGNDAVPIEVKSGTKGSMQSLFLFLDAKKVHKGIRISEENFGKYDKVDVYPLYAAANILHSR